MEAQATKEKFFKLDFIKINILCIKAYYQENEESLQNRIKIASPVAAKSLDSRIHKETLQFNNRKTITFLPETGKGLG